MNDDYEFTDKWCLWYHSINDTTWKNNSYKLILEINNLYDFKIMLDNIKNEYFHNSMLFLMRKGIFPNWEDINNIQGSCISLKINIRDILKQWELLISLIITKRLFNTEDKNKNINGLSITPKKEFNIFKIWFTTDTRNLKGINIHKPYLMNKNFMYKKNNQESVDPKPFAPRSLKLNSSTTSKSNG